MARCTPVRSAAGTPVSRVKISKAKRRRPVGESEVSYTWRFLTGVNSSVPDVLYSYVHGSACIYLIGGLYSIT